MANACTDPVFVPADAGSDAGDAAGPREGQRTEPEAGGPEPTTEAGCDGTACRDEGGVALDPGDASSEEAGSEPQPDAGLDEVRKKWAGRYAARSTLFSFDDPLKNTAKLLSIVTIAPTPEGGLRLEEEMCFYEGGWSLLITGHIQYTFNETRGSAALNYTNDDFESELMTLRVGYGPTPDGCRPGATMRKSDEQVWITSSSSCDCPRNDDTPTNARDCRITDQEDDKRAGATFLATVETQTITYRAVQEERVLLRKGYRVGDRLYADREFADTTNILDCTVGTTVTPAASCPGGGGKNCPSKYNKVELVPLLDPKHTCTQVIAQEPGLFVSVLPPFPPTCAAEVAGN